MRLDVKRRDLDRALAELRGRRAFLILVDRRGTPGAVRAGRDRVLYPNAAAPKVLDDGEYEALEAMARRGKLTLCKPFVPKLPGRLRSRDGGAGA